MMDNKIFFSKIFVALIPYIDRFVYCCISYLEIDWTYLMVKWKGQLVAVASINGHNWLFPIACEIFYLEIIKNWTWFMTQLQKAIQTLSGLAISSDVDKPQLYIIFN
jgi:MULE transposase domain